MRMTYAVGSPNTPLYADAQASAAIGWLVEGVPVELRSPVRNGRVRITVRRELTLNAWVDAGQLSEDYVPVRPASSRLLDYEGDKYGEVIRLAANTHLFAPPGHTSETHANVRVAIAGSACLARVMHETQDGALVIISGQRNEAYIAGIARGRFSIQEGGRAEVVGQAPIYLNTTQSGGERFGYVSPGAVVEVKSAVQVRSRRVLILVRGAFVAAGWVELQNLRSTSAPFSEGAPVTPAAIVAAQDGRLIGVRAGTEVMRAGAMFGRLVHSGHARVLSVDATSADVYVAANNLVAIRGRVPRSSLVALDSSAPRQRRAMASTPLEAAIQSVVRVWCPVGTGLSTGSGVLVSPRGNIISNFHVVGDSQTGRLHNNGLCIAGASEDAEHPPQPQWFVQVVESERRLDIAYLRVARAVEGHSLPNSYPFLQVGQRASIGDRVTVLGFPGTDTIQATFGHVSGFQGPFIRTDAEVNPGNSGGAMIDDEGRLVGVPTFVIRQGNFEPVGFAIPLSQIRALRPTGFSIGR